MMDDSFVPLRGLLLESAEPERERLVFRFFLAFPLYGLTLEGSDRSKGGREEEERRERERDNGGRKRGGSGREKREVIE